MKHIIKRKQLTAAVLVILVGLVAVLTGYSARPASAHLSKTIGNVTLELGWQTEPALTGQMNGADLSVFTGSSNKPNYVINAMANMETTLVYGNANKKLEFLPSPTTEGHYLAPILPTKEGTYVVQFKGKIQDQSIDTTINLDDVGSVDTVSFPPTSQSSDGGPIVPAQIEQIISQLTNDITAAKTSADNAAQTAADSQKAVQDAKTSADRAYMIGLTGIGVGIAGIVIAVMAMSRRESKLLQR